MQTPDGRWRVDILRRGDAQWYRVRHDGNEFDWLELADVERVLSGAGVDLGRLQPDARSEPA
jgi:bifunctional non-homologous end joining protein LigD